MAGALRRNLFGTVDVDDHRLAAVVAYMRREIAGLAGQSGNDLLAGEIAETGGRPCIGVGGDERLTGRWPGIAFAAMLFGTVDGRR